MALSGAWYSPQRYVVARCNACQCLAPLGDAREFTGILSTSAAYSCLKETPRPWRLRRLAFGARIQTAPHDAAILLLLFCGYDAAAAIPLLR